MLGVEYNGKDHVAVAIVLNNLGNVYGVLGDPTKQRKLLERAIEIQEKHHGEEHVEVAMTLTNLGNACGDRGEQWKKTDPLKRALTIEERHYGEDHFQIAITLTNLGTAYGEELLERALKIKERRSPSSTWRLVTDSSATTGRRPKFCTGSCRFFNVTSSCTMSTSTWPERNSRRPIV